MECECYTGAVCQMGRVIWANKVTPGFKKKGMTPENIQGRELWSFARNEEPVRLALADSLMRRQQESVRMECDTGEVLNCTINPVPDGIRSIIVCDTVPSGQGHITDRERQVIALLAADHPPRVIARKLGIAPSTAETHIHNAKGRLGIATNTGLVAYAIRNGIV